MGWVANLTQRLDELNEKLDDKNRQEFDSIVKNSPFSGSNMELHYSDEQRIRFERAKQGQVCIIKIDKWLHCGKFKSQSDYKKVYKTTLNDCTCPDYSERHKPCKHMYKLAFELGVIDPNTDLSGIPVELSSLILKLSFNAMELFRRYLCENQFYPGVNNHKRTPAIEELITKHLLIEVCNYQSLLDKNYTRNDIIAELVTSKSKYPVSSNVLKRDMIDWIIANDERLFKRLIKKFVFVKYSPDISPFLPFLYRKYVTEYNKLYE